jgi:hypothetical protein
MHHSNPISAASVPLAGLIHSLGIWMLTICWQTELTCEMLKCITTIPEGVGTCLAGGYCKGAGRVAPRDQGFGRQTPVLG